MIYAVDSAIHRFLPGGGGGGPGEKPTSDMHLTRYSILVVWSESDACALPCLFSSFQGMVEEVNLSSSLRGCLHDTGATFAPAWVHSGSLSWLYICLHDTTTKCNAGVNHPGCCTGARISLRYEISQRYHVNAKRISVWNRSAGRLERVAHA